MNNFFRLLISLLIPIFVGVLAAYLTTPHLAWYSSLHQPTLSPPNWFFGSVWTALFILMGIAFYLTWTKKTKLKKTHAYRFYFLQLLLNPIWFHIFFTLRLPPIALVEIIVLWLAVALTIVEFHAISKTAAYLLIPYILWISFATYLNYQIVLLN